MFIGEIIKDYRIKNNLSQRGFASRTSLSPSYINTLEKIYNPKNGKPYSVTTNVVKEIAKAMHITIEELLIMIDKEVADGGNFFTVHITDNSMEPAFFEGDVVVIRKQNDCENNQVAFVVSGNEGILRKVKKTSEGIILQPFNSDYDSVVYTNKEIKEIPVMITGVFEELRRTELKF